jgi:biopolymer transport protein ExbD/biopolymer transport protein TolR
VTFRAAVEPPCEPEMNVTPLVDVVLVLLIVFMVIAPRLEHDVAVNLPSVVNPDPEGTAGTEPLTIAVAPTGQIYVDGQAYDLPEAVAALEVAHAADPLRRLVVRGDDSLRFGQIRAVCAQARKIGFPGVALSVGERHRHDDGGSDDERAGAPPAGAE